MKTTNFIKSASDVIISRESTFNAQRNVIYRVFFQKDDFDVETKKQVLSLSEDSKSLLAVVNVVHDAKKSENSATINNRLKAACFFNVSVTKDEIHISYTVKQVLNAANTILNNAEAPVKALKLEVLNEMIETNKKKLSKAHTWLSEIKAKLKETTNDELKEIYLAKHSDCVTKVEKLNKIADYLKAERKELTK